jgi:hypothetical protein
VAQEGLLANGEQELLTPLSGFADVDVEDDRNKVADACMAIVWAWIFMMGVAS